MRRIILPLVLGGSAFALQSALPNRREASVSRPEVKTLDSTSASDSVTQVSMRDVNFFIIPHAALRIRTLRGDMRAFKGGPVVFDDKNSFVIGLKYAEIGLNGDDISTLMNAHIFAYPGAPLKKLKVHTAGSQLVQSGVMHKIIDIPFEITSNVSVTPEGLIRLHPVKSRILGVDGNALMRAFGLTLEKILDLRKAKGVTVKGNDFLLDPTKILPPPAIEGHATGIRIDGNELVQTFGAPDAAPPLSPPDTAAPSFMFYKGGTLHFGKLLMLDAEMEIVDRRPSGFFDFDLDRYKEQLVAGYSRTLPDLGLEVYMLGLDKLASAGQPVKP
ncbi:MAG TPA: hypothetical protein VE110_02260 [Gemmatimonadaceae bacterium]|jgi:hypothetical protein|nr:hypothetical protein [Gemmatimonadaceae bacterium]